MTEVTTPADIDVHARIVLEKALTPRPDRLGKGSSIGIANDIIEQAYKGSEDVLELINRAEQRLSAIGENQIGGGIESPRIAHGRRT